jgi:profilin
MRVQVKPEELKAIVASFTDSGGADQVKKVQREGFYVGGERYVVIKADDRSLYGKKVGGSSGPWHRPRTLSPHHQN